MTESTRNMVFALFVLAAFCVIEIQGGEFCYKGGYGYHHGSTATWCTYGCCGPSYDEYCCGAEVGLIVGCVFAGIVVVCVLVALVCCCIKKQGHAGRVVAPATNTQPYATNNVTVVYSGTSGQYPGPYGAQPIGRAQPAAPPAYKQFENPPPAYTYSDPAYPPSAPAFPPPPPASTSSNPPPPGFNVSAGGVTSTAPPNTNLRQ